MRIAFIVHEFPKLSETFVLNQAIGLIERGHDVDIYTHEINGTEQAHPDVNKYGLLDHTYELPIMPYSLFLRVILALWLLVRNFHRNPAMFLRSLNIGKYGIQVLGLRQIFASVALADKAPYDIIHSQFGTQSFNAVSFARVLQPTPKTITTFRGYDISAFLKKKGDHVYNRIFKQIDFFLTNSDFFCKRVIKIGCNPSKIRVNRSGLDCSQYTFSPRFSHPDQVVKLVTTGRLVEKKGIIYSIQAVAKVLPNHPNLRYLIIGDGPLKEDFQHLINRLGVSHAVHLMGWKNVREIVDILADSDLFIAPSVTAQDGDQDAPINVLKEAMALGMPVISTWHGGIPELVSHGVSGLLAPERDSETLAEHIDYLMRHPEQWESMGRAGRAMVEKHYNLTDLNNQLIELYDMILNTPQTTTLTADSGLISPLAKLLPWPTWVGKVRQ
ncbi:MAG: colanic acid biosynthesis glycosyltransferase WcaL [Leptolyngbyaceae cyanobacterium SM2_5_2]|nr:colanic acid biosynthesis glycosyltransferase WcaL [Leptolyngbyaceae cyanobacterium SM2_5_2]